MQCANTKNQNPKSALPISVNEVPLSRIIILCKVTLLLYEKFSPFSFLEFVLRPSVPHSPSLPHQQLPFRTFEILVQLCSTRLNVLSFSNSRGVETFSACINAKNKTMVILQTNSCLFFHHNPIWRQMSLFSPKCRSCCLIRNGFTERHRIILYIQR